VGEISDDPRQSDIRDILEEIQQSGGTGISNRGRIIHCLKHFHKRGLSLATCADSRHLNRSIGYLQDCARELKLRFPDYIPYALRTDEERKRGKRA
jgi:hypothetical protein